MRALVKVNLTLHVGAVRPDGYHPVSSVCVFPDLGDEVELGQPQDDFSLTIEGPEADGLAGEAVDGNLVMRAAQLMQEAAGVTPRGLRLRKTVPVAAGIAGGTADAAAALVLLNGVADRPLPGGELIALSRQLGADGPVCTAARLAGGGAWLARGDGDVVERLPDPPPLTALLANPRRPVSTARVFARFDEAGRAGELDQAGDDTGTLSGLLRIASGGRNDLRGAAFAEAPVVAALEERMAASEGCLFARMSGSGGTVAGLFGDTAAAAKAMTALRAEGHWAAAAPLAAGA